MTTFGFGTQTQAPAFGGFSFGAATSTTSTPSFASSSFANPATNVSGSGLAFGATPTTVTSSLFGATPGFSNPTSSTSLFPALGQTTTTSAPSGFNFGATPSLSSTGMNFGTAMPPTSLTTAFVAPVVGLGGVDLQASSINGASTTAAKKDKALKETFIPQELLATVETFKKYVKEQKAIREEMSRVSSKNILRVQSQVATFRQQLSVVSNGLQRNAIAIAKLKQESSEELRNAEISQRTKDIPPALQYENTAPTAYFHNLAISFENQMQSYRQQIEQLERHLLSLSQPSTMTPSELTVVMRRLHDAFVTLAAQLQTVHQQVQFQKEQFLALKRANDSDMSNIFHSRKPTTSEITLRNGRLPVPVTIGPSPLIVGPNAAVTAIANLRNRTQDGNMSLGVGGASATGLATSLTGSNFMNTSQFSLGNTFGLSSGSSLRPLKPLGLTSGVPSFSSPGLGAGTSGFLSESVPQSPYTLSNQKPFQLQKPPSGNKRGKRWTST